MTLIFDENLSHKLPQIVTPEFPGCEHVRNVGLLGATDEQIWGYARTHGFVIVSKDTDFRDRTATNGPPPKFIWLDVGNAGTLASAYLLRQEWERIEAFETDPEASLLVLSIGPRRI